MPTIVIHRHKTTTTNNNNIQQIVTPKKVDLSSSYLQKASVNFPLN